MPLVIPETVIAKSTEMVWGSVGFRSEGKVINQPNPFSQRAWTYRFLHNEVLFPIKAHVYFLPLCVLTHGSRRIREVPYL